jgi:hypothetical protein
MNKSVLVLLFAVGSLISVIPSFADNNQTGDNKVVKTSKKIGRGLMWGPKKIGNGVKNMSEKGKNFFHKGSKPQTAK